MPDEPKLPKLPNPEYKAKPTKFLGVELADPKLPPGASKLLNRILLLSCLVITLFAGILLGALANGRYESAGDRGVIVLDKWTGAFSAAGGTPVEFGSKQE